MDINRDLGVGLRKMSSDDLSYVYDIETQCFQDPWAMVLFEECLKYNECLVLCKMNAEFGIRNSEFGIPNSELRTPNSELNSDIIGYFIGVDVLEEYTICSLAIKPEYQGKGFGGYMISTIIKNHNQSFERYFLETRKGNIQAISLYKKLGFTYLYERKGYYQNPVEDAIVMEMLIKQK